MTRYDILTAHYHDQSWKRDASAIALNAWRGGPMIGPSPYANGYDASALPAETQCRLDHLLDEARHAQLGN